MATLLLPGVFGSGEKSIVFATLVKWNGNASITWRIGHLAFSSPTPQKIGGLCECSVCQWAWDIRESRVPFFVGRGAKNWAHRTECGVLRQASRNKRQGAKTKHPLPSVSSCVISKRFYVRVPALGNLIWQGKWAKVQSAMFQVTFAQKLLLRNTNYKIYRWGITG